MYNAKEKLFLIVLFFAALASLVFFLNFRTFAFPEHNIKFDINRDQAAGKSKEFVKDLQLNPDSFKEATTFSIDNATKTYLEREVGVTETARLAANDVAAWQFTTRFFKPSEQEEISVAHLPNGRFAGFYRQIEEAAIGSSLDKAQAQQHAEKFLTEVVKTDISNWKLVNSEEVERPNRVDHTFTWEKNGFKAKDATYRVDVYVYGDRIGGYIEYLKIPEAWMRAYEKETSNNDLAQTVAEALMILVFGLAILITFIIQYRRNNLRIAPLRIIGIIAGAIAILTSLNSLPLSLAAYPTTISWEAFIGSIVLISILGGFFQGASVMLVITAGEAKYREMFPNGLALEKSFRGALQTKEVNKALFIGVFAGIIFFAYEVLYYFLGKGVGFWAPADVNYSDIFSTVLPFLYPLFIGFMAAISEEGIFRLFGIPFLKKYLKSTWAAILITSVIWAFLHSNYPQSPWFVRGIEITVIGVVLGWLFVRFGFIASFTAHYTFNALQTAIYFFVSGSLYASLTSVAVSLLPFIIALVILGKALRGKGFAVMQKEFLNNSLHNIKEAKVPAAPKPKDTKYRPLSNAGKQYLIALSMLSIFLLWALYSKTSLEHVPTSQGRSEVIQKADETLAKRGVAIDSYQKTTTFTPVTITMEEEYILEKENFDTLKQIYPEKLPLAYWTVRYFKPLEKEEFSVDVLPDGSIYQVVHTIDEKAPGKNLNTEQARKIADQYLVSEKGYNLAEYKLVENKDEKKDKRTDHNFVYEEQENKIGEAAFRTDVIVMGDEVSGYNRYLKLPEQWERDKTETTTLDFIIGGLVVIFGVMILGFGVKTFFELLRVKQLPFKQAYILAGIVTAVTLIATFNSLSTFFANYDTAVPQSSYIIQSILTLILGLVFTFFSFAVVFGMFIALWRQYVGQLILTDDKERDAYLKDALLSGYGVPVILTGISSVLLYILITKDWLTSVATFDIFPPLDVYVPFISTLSELPIAVGGACFAVSATLLLKKYLKSWTKVLISLFIIAILLGIPQQRTAEELLVSILQNVALLVGVTLVVVLILRKNMLAYLIMLYSSLLFGSGWVLFEQTNLFFKINGVILLLLTLLPILLYFLRKRLVTSF